DRLGEKPFFYASERNGLVFGSEIKALLAAGIPRTINEQMLYGYFRNPSNAAVRGSFDGTYYEGILKLPSATYLTVSNGVPKHRQRYWKLDLAEPGSISFDDAKEKFTEMFTGSVRLRLRSDVEVGSSLSGGIDSSGIVCTIPRVAAGGTKYNTFSARFKNFEADEGEYIDEVNRAAGTVAHSVYPTEDDLAAGIAAMFYYQDEPLESSSAFAQWSVMRLASSAGVTVLLDGQGGDELAAGYHSYFEPHLRDLWRRDPAMGKSEATAIRQRFNIRLDDNSGDAGATNGNGSSVRAMAMRQRTRRALSQTPLVRAMPAGGTFLSRSFLWANGEDQRGLNLPLEGTLSEALKSDLIDGKLEHYLRYADRNSMAHSREVRLPFLSHRLIEFMFSIPSEYKIRDGWPKYLVRSAFQGLVPEKILWRKEKVGFATPEARWMHSEAMKPLVTEAREYLTREGILNRRWKDTGDRNWQMVMAYLLVSGSSNASTRPLSNAAFGAT
ncbi:MAG: asparagine synthase-related protein, partial [Gemmatimonadaceae bacterium]